MKNIIIFIIFAFALLLYSSGEDSPFGMNHEIFETQYSFDDDPEYKQKYKTSMDLSVAAGIKWWRAKNAFRWCDIQPDNLNDWNFETEDSLVKWAGERGLHLLPVIGNTAKWAHHYDIPSKKSPYWIKYPPNPEHWVDYENYVKALVERYDGDGIDDYEDLKIPIKHWEFMNEPYLDSDFLGTPEQYVEMFGYTWAALKSADSTAKILGPCFTSRESNTFKWKYYDTATGTIIDTNLGPWDQALKNLINSIGSDSIDIISHHLYKEADLFSSYVTRLREIVDESKPIWITESGFQNSSRLRAVRGKEQICDETGSLRLVKYSSDTGEVFRDTVWVQQGNLESCFDTVITFLDTGDTVILKYRTNWWKSDTVIYNGGDLIYIKGENTVTALAINDTLTIYKVWARETEYNCPDSQKTRYSELLDTIINTPNFLRNLKVFFFCVNNNMNIHYYPPVIEFGNTPYEPTVYVPTAYYRQRLHNLYSVIDTNDNPYPAYNTIKSYILSEEINSPEDNSQYR